jgi:synaptic vesicle membrane protein VAT-1
MAKRVRVYKPGSWSGLVIEDFECPEPGQGEVKVDVKAAGINFADVCVRQGLYSSANEFVGFPITPGFETAGTVASVGKMSKVLSQVTALSRLPFLADTAVKLR